MEKPTKMVDEEIAESGEQDETTTEVESTENPVAQAKPEAEDVEQVEKPEADEVEAKAEEKDEDKGEPEKKPNKKPASERIRELNQKWRDEQRETARLTKQIERLRNVEKPDAGKYEDPDEYTSDLAVYKMDQRQAANLEESAQDAGSRAQQTLAEAHNERVMDFAAETPDFHNVAQNPALQITPNMANEIMDSDMGPQVQYYLGKNKDEAMYIASLSPNHQIRAIGKLEAKVSAPAPKRVTQAPAPIKPIGDGKSKAKRTPNDMSVAELAKYLTG